MLTRYVLNNRLFLVNTSLKIKRLCMSKFKLYSFRAGGLVSIPIGSKEENKKSKETLVLDCFLSTKIGQTWYSRNKFVNRQDCKNRILYLLTQTIKRLAWNWFKMRPMLGFTLLFILSILARFLVCLYWCVFVLNIYLSVDLYTVQIYMQYPHYDPL